MQGTLPSLCESALNAFKVMGTLNSQNTLNVEKIRNLQLDIAKLQNKLKNGGHFQNDDNEEMENLEHQNDTEINRISSTS